MTLFKRLLTAMVLFVFLFIFFYFLICMVGGGIAGARAGQNQANHPANFQEGYKVGAQAGADFVRQNIHAILGSTFALAALSSLGLSFSGLFPWCRKPVEPPPL